MWTRRRFIGATAFAAAIPAANAPGSLNYAPPKFQLGLVTYNLAAKWNLPTLLKACRAANVAAVEFRTTHAHGVEPTLTAVERRDVKRQCGDAGVAIWGCGTTCEFQAPDHAVVRSNIETCKQFVRLVADLGGRGVKVRPNALPKEVPAEKSLEQIGKALIQCGDAAADAGVEIWVEVHGPGTQLPANMKTIMEVATATGHKSVGVTWNSNATDVVRGSVRESFELLKPWIKSCHINELYKDARGEYPYRELFGLLRGIGYDRYTLCEVGRTPQTPDDGVEILKYYQALWRELASG
jgi:sugar phosphate isomerase/epimerase